MGNFTCNHFGGYDVKPKMGLWVVYDTSGKQPRPAMYSDGGVVIFPCAFDAYFWIIKRLLGQLGKLKA